MAKRIRKKKVVLTVTHGEQTFELMSVIGVGSFGKVLQVRHQRNQKLYAMKITSKKFLQKHKHLSYMRVERDVMTKMRHPFLVKLKWAFHTVDKVYLVMPYMPGGELFRLIREEGILLESNASFYGAEMVLALEHLHSLHIIHRDLKVSARA